MFAAFDTDTGQVISSLHRRHRATEWLKFLKKIDQQVPEHLEIHLICDNYGTHKTPTINAWLDKHPRFHMHFTPTGSSWINQVERWFGFLDDQAIRRGAHKSVQALEADIRAWAASWNENPRPFIWTKTAEQILESLANVGFQGLHVLCAPELRVSLAVAPSTREGIGFDPEAMLPVPVRPSAPFRIDHSLYVPKGPSCC